MIVPEIWSDSKVAELAIKAGNEAVTAFIGIFSLADDEGCFEANPYNIIIKLPGISRQWNVELVTNWLRTMNEIGLVQLYSSDDGKQYLFLPSWFKNQTIPKPYPSSLPRPPKDLVEKHQNYKDNLIKMYLKMKDRYEAEYAKSKSNQCFDDFVPYEFKTGYELVTNWFNTSNDKKRKERKGNIISSSSNIENLQDDKKSKSSDIGMIANFYEQNFGLLSPHIIEKLKSYIEDFTTDLIIKAMELAVDNNKRTIRYVEGILNKWQQKGIKTVEAAELESKKFKEEMLKNNKKQNKSYKTNREKSMDAIQEFLAEAETEEFG